MKFTDEEFSFSEGDGVGLVCLTAVGDMISPFAVTIQSKPISASGKLRTSTFGMMCHS